MSYVILSMVVLLIYLFLLISIIEFDGDGYESQKDYESQDYEIDPFYYENISMN